MSNTAARALNSDSNKPTEPSPAKPSLDDLKEDVRQKLAAITAAEKRAAAHADKAKAAREEAEGYRVEAAIALCALRRRVEADGHKWWRWFQGYKKNLGTSKSNAEKLLAIGEAEDPRAAHKAEKEATRTRVAKGREKKTAVQADVRRNEPEGEAEPEPRPRGNLCVRSNCVQARAVLTEVKASVEPDEWARFVVIWPGLNQFIEAQGS